MITLITGTPGAGKTAWTVQEITRLPAQRKIYVHGVPELKIAHEPIYCFSELCEYCRSIELPPEPEGEFTPLNDWPLFVEFWPDWATDGSLIIIDEVQRIWRPENSSRTPAEGIARLETHRHKGLDFWLISQGPHLFHSNIRLLVGRHIHLVANWRGRSEYEFPECRQNVTSRSDAIVRPYKLPKKIFDKYKSASLHTKLNKRKPLSLYVFAACILSVIALGGNIVSRIYDRAHPELNSPAMASMQIAPELPAGAPAQAGGAGAIASADTLGVQPVKTPFPDFTPVKEGVPESAPAYSELIKVTSVPVLAGCTLNKKTNDCRCYTHQATPYPASQPYCVEMVKGHRFNPFALPVSVTASSVSPSVKAKSSDDTLPPSSPSRAENQLTSDNPA